MMTKIIFSIDYKGNGHILSVEDKDWIEKELIISADMDDNGIGLPVLEHGIYSADLIFYAGRGWLNGDVYDAESMDLENINKLFSNE